jgi:hypothetical protein
MEMGKFLFSVVHGGLPPAVDSMKMLELQP